MTEEQVTQTDFYLKLTSEADMPTVLSAFYRQDTKTEFDDETGEETVVNVGEPYFVPHTHDYAIDVVGVIHKPTGNMLTSDEGFEYPEMAALDGWHINIRILNDNKRADVEALSDYFVDPEPMTPSRVWA
jgi:hypothetical protein